jgi:hypothetical protein
MLIYAEPISAVLERGAKKLDITSFTPTNGGPGTVVTLSLTGMPPNTNPMFTAVYLSGSPSVNVGDVQVNPDGSGSITVTIEENAQSGNFTVLVASTPQAAAQSSDIFTVPVPPGRPAITSMSPTTAVVNQTMVTLNGHDFDDIEWVIVSNAYVTTFTLIGNTAVRFRVPSSVSPGSVRVGLGSKEYGRIMGSSMLTVTSALTASGGPPSLGAISPEAVIAAWADLAPWVQGTLPGLAQSSSLPSESQDVGDIGACNALNGFGNESGAFWGSDGDATVTLTSLTISAMAGVSIQPAVAVDSSTVQLPLSFSQLEVTGSYSYGQPCALYDLGKKASTTTANGNGSITQTIGASSLYYVAKLGSTVTLSSVVVNGNPSVNVSPDTGGLPDWLVKIASFFQTFDEAAALRSSLQNVFLTADFSQQMIGLLNQKIGG